MGTWRAAQIAGHPAAGGDLLEVSRAARAMPAPPRPPRPVGLLLDGLSLLVTDGPAAAAPALRRAKRAFAGPDVPVSEQLRLGWMAPVVGAALWDDGGYSLIERPVQLARDTGRLDRLPMLLNQLASAAVWWGEFAAAASLIAEADAICEATGARIPPYAAMRLASLQGREAEAAPLIEAAVEEAAAVGQGIAMAAADWATASLYHGLGRYADALAAARQAVEHAQVNISMWALPELVEAAARTGDTQLASDTLDQLVEWTRAGGTDWGLGVEARCRALLSDGEHADRLYREAITRLGRTRIRPELARAHLLYGEWLRRQRRRTDAREQLRTACQLLDEIGMEAFAERARHELRATGASARRRAVAANGGVSTHGITEWRDIAGSLAYARTRPGTRDMTIGLFSRCMGAVATFAAMTRWPAAFDGVRCLVSPQPVTPRIIVERRLAVMGLGDRLDDFNTLIRLRTSVGLDQRVPQEWAKNVRVPTFLYQVRGDILIHPSDVQAMFDNILVAEKKLQWIEGTTARWDGYLEFQRRPQPMLDWFAQYM